MPIQISGATDQGKVRSSNEDFFLIDKELNLAIVCDGVSGNVCGGVAARITAETIKNEIKTRGASANAPLAVIDLIHLAVTKANDNILEEVKKDPSKATMSTTLEMVWIKDSHVFIGHVGDSCVYLVRKGKFHKLTTDHKASVELKKQGWRDEQIENSPYRNMLTRAVGASSFVSADVLQFESAPGDLLVICSDGLSDYFKAEKLGPLLSRPDDFEKFPQSLIDYANGCGGRDNITVVTVGIAQAKTSLSAVDALKKGEVLGRIPLFKHLEYAELLKVLATMTLFESKAGEAILNEGDPSDHMIITIKGQVEIVKAGQVIARRSDGEVFGEMGLFDAAPRSASVRTTEVTSFLKVSRHDLVGLMKKEPVIAVKLLWALTQELNVKLRNTTQDLVELRRASLTDQDTDVETPFN